MHSLAPNSGRCGGALGATASRSASFCAMSGSEIGGAAALLLRAMSHMRAHLAGIDAQLAALDHELCQVATSAPWCDPVRFMCSFRGIGLLTRWGLRVAGTPRS